ncbi:MAG: (2Fe-2S) ferredoxin domain-containing protein [Bacillota bacterium]
MKSLAELNNLKEEYKNSLTGAPQEKPQIIVGMSTCGIAAGARKIYKAIENEIDEGNINADLIKTGCIGMCEKEPLIDVVNPGQDRVTYGNLNPEIVGEIIIKHISENEINEEHVIARHSNK